MEDALRASEQGLEIIDQARKRKGWNRQSAAWCQVALTTLSCLKQFWRRERIHKETFIRLCQAVGVHDWQAIADLPGITDPISVPYSGTSTGVASLLLTPSYDWGEAPEVSFFCGRSEELSTLKQWLQDRCKLVAILGMGGMGKTTLSAVLVDQIVGEFDCLIWRSLRNAPPLAAILTDWIPFLSRQQQLTLPESLDRQLSLLMNCLRERRCLVVLDNVESILCEGNSENRNSPAAGLGCYRSGYEGYGELLRRVGEERHQSCLLLTSRELPREVVWLEGEKIRTLHLQGLSQAEGQKILEKIGSFCASNSEGEAIVAHYAGNPLALKIVAAGIRGLLDNDIAKFLDLLRQGSFTFSDIRDLLERHFNRLSHLEQEVMYWLAITREPISLDTLQADLLSPESRYQLTDTLASLKRRSLLETSPAGFTLQPAVMEYTTNRLIEQVCGELVTQHLTLLRNHALIKAQAKDYIREAQTRLILEPLIERLQAVYGTRQDLNRLLAQILPRYQGKPAVQTGYIAGNLLNLLGQLQADLSDSDFSGLTIWQAYLQGAILNRVDFSCADLAKSVFTGTFSSVLSLAFSPDGKTLASSDERGWLYLWQVADGKQLLAVQAHHEWVFSVTFSPDGQTLATGSLDRTAKLWDVSSGQCLQTLQMHAGGVSAVAFSPDGKILASGSGDHTIKFTNPQTGECLETLEGHDGIVRTIAFSPNGQTLASGCLAQRIQLWDVNSGQCVKTLQDSCAVLAVAFVPTSSDDPEASFLVSAGDDGKVKLWDLLAGECVAQLKGHSSSIWSLVVSPDGKTLISGSNDQTIKLWDLDSGEALRTLQGHQNRVWSVALSPDGQTLASGSEDKTLKLWDTTNGYCLRTVQGYHNATSPIAFVQDTLFTFSEDQRVRLWDINSRQCLKTLRLPTQGVMQAALSADGRTLATGSLDHTVRLWAVENGDRLGTLQGHTAWVRFVAFAPSADSNSLILASASGDKTIKLWNYQTGECLKTLEGHTNPVQSLTFSSDGQLLASNSWDWTVKLWNVHTGECLGTLEGHTNRVGASVFSPDGQILVSGGQDQTIRFWDIKTAECLRILESHQGGIVALAYHSAEVLASASLDGTVKLWSTSNGECLRTLSVQIGYSSTILFSPDGQTLSIGSQDGTCNLFEPQTGQCLKTLQVPRPYEGLKITGATGLTAAQRMTLKVLGAVEEN